MLKNQDTVPEPPISVSKARVTPEELTAALAVIEKRRQAEAARVAGTIPLDEAISELHLDSTPDEIWTEVQKQRSQASETRSEQANQAPGIQPFMAFQRQKRRRFWRRLIPATFLCYGLSYFGILPHSWSGTTRSAPVLRPLAQVPIGAEVYADDTALAQAAAGKPLTQITVSENAAGNRWRLVKIGAHVYLRGYIVSTDSLQSLQGKPLSLYSDDNSGGLFGKTVSTITVRVDSIPLQKSGGYTGFSEVTIPNFQPDALTTLDQ